MNSDLYFLFLGDIVPFQVDVATDSTTSGTLYGSTGFNIKYIQVPCNSGDFVSAPST